MSDHILALDQGTTSSRAIVFDRQGRIAAMSQHAFSQHYPQDGWVEHDPMEIWETERLAAAEAIAGFPEGSIAGIGVTNQRETTILWDKTTGQPVYNAIVWQCRRTAELCEDLKRQGLDERIQSATGLLIDAYFSGSKIRWILDNVPGVRRRAERGEVLFGTVETWLIWQLTGRHVTDYSNASRTMLFDIHRLCWDEELCGILGVPMAMLPQPVPNCMIYGTVRPGIEGLEKLAGVPVCGAAGDQQAALFGQTCFAPRRSQEYIRHRLLHPDERGWYAGAQPRGPCDLRGVAAWAARPPTLWRAASLTEAAPSSGCGTSCSIISSAPEMRQAGGVGAGQRRRGGGTGLHGAGRALLGHVRPRRGAGHHPRYRPGPSWPVPCWSAIAYQVTDLMLAMRQDAGCDITMLRADGGASVSLTSCCRCRRICCASP